MRRQVGFYRNLARNVHRRLILAARLPRAESSGGNATVLTRTFQLKTCRSVTIPGTASGDLLDNVGGESRRSTFPRHSARQAEDNARSRCAI